VLLKGKFRTDALAESIFSIAGEADPWLPFQYPFEGKLQTIDCVAIYRRRSAFFVVRHSSEQLVPMELQ
jgi:hypothetical protein